METRFLSHWCVRGSKSTPVGEASISAQHAESPVLLYVELPRHMNSLTLQKATERNIQMNPANFFILQGYLKSKSKQNILISPPIPACNYNLLYQELLCLCVTLSRLWTLGFSSTENESLENANIFIDSISVLSRGSSIMLNAGDGNRTKYFLVIGLPGETEIQILTIQCKLQ